MHTNWHDSRKSRLEGPVRIPVAPYHYLCDGQLTNCVPQRGAERRLDAQGDKIMARLVYRRIGAQQSIVAVHSVNTTAGGGGVRWYEFRLRWQDYTQTAIDPEDDCTIWYVGDYMKKGITSYSTRIGAFRLPGCGGAGR